MKNKVNLLESPKQFKSTAERHAWNRKFVELCEAMDDPRTPEEHSYLQGWKPNSGVSANYIHPVADPKTLEGLPEKLKND